MYNDEYDEYYDHCCECHANYCDCRLDDNGEIVNACDSCAITTLRFVKKIVEKKEETVQSERASGLISREDTIAMLKEHFAKEDGSTETGIYRCHKEVLDILLGMPAKEAVHEKDESNGLGWIPCSKKMPDKNGLYLSTIAGRADDPSIPPIVGMSHWWNGRWFSCITEDTAPGMGYDPDRTIAWMPLPECYRGDGTATVPFYEDRGCREGMTREEAKSVLKNVAFLATNASFQDIEEAVAVAISALEQPELR